MNASTVADGQSNKPTHGKAIVIGLWIVAIYFIWTAGSALFSFALFFTGFFSMTPEQFQYFLAMPKFLIEFTILLMAFNLIGGVLLIMRRRVALYVLVLSGILNLISHVYTLASRGLPPRILLENVVVPYVLLFGILLFVYVLYRKRVLWR